MKRGIRAFAIHLRNRHLLALDFVGFVIAPTLALILRTESLDQVQHFGQSLVLYTIVALVCKLGVYIPVGLYNRYWRYASVDELATLSIATVSSTVLVEVVFFGILLPFGLIQHDIPRSLPTLDGILTMIAIGGLRLAVRLGHAIRIKHRYPTIAHRRGLIVGAGVAGSMIVKELRANQQVGLEPVGFIDDDPEKLGANIHGVKVLGTRREFERIVKEYEIDEVIVAMPNAPGKVIRDVVQACKKVQVQSKTIPGYFEILSGEARVSQIRDIKIEDLLRRGPVKTDNEKVGELIHGARVMVTGGGGSIGSELVRQIMGFMPKELVLLGHGENSIYEIAEELKPLTQAGHSASSVKVYTVIADIRDRARMEQIFHLHRPTVVFHAAAHKHVPLMEMNITDAVTNNVLGTRNIVELCEQFRVKRFVMISSDKAVNPTSVMGVTKRIAELVVRDVAEKSGGGFVTVRFGNVLGSSGSVVPLFERQIAQGGPITVTDPEVKRYFMTIPEAVQLVLQAATMGRGGEVFVLDMGEPIRVVDLARDLIRLNGLREGTDIDIHYTGLRPGEKLFEELFLGNEKVERTAHEKILVCKNGRTHLPAAAALGSVAVSYQNMPGTLYPSPLRVEVDHLITASQHGTVWLVRHLLKKIVPEYQPIDRKPREVPMPHPTVPVRSIAPSNVPASSSVGIVPAIALKRENTQL